MLKNQKGQVFTSMLGKPAIVADSNGIIITRGGMLGSGSYSTDCLYQADKKTSKRIYKRLSQDSTKLLNEFIRDGRL